VHSMDKGIKTTLEFTNKTWKILQQAKRMLGAKKYMPYYQKYLTLSEEIRAKAFPFKSFYTLWYGRWPKDLDEDYFKSTTSCPTYGQEVKKDEHEGQWRKHASSHVDQCCGGAPPPPPLEPAPEARSQGERSGSALPSALPERSPSGAFLGSALPLKNLRSLVF
jgi:hypothetical protein